MIVTLLALTKEGSDQREPKGLSTAVVIRAHFFGRSRL
jgi:hypothetical protein